MEFLGTLSSDKPKPSGMPWIGWKEIENHAVLACAMVRRCYMYIYIYICTYIRIIWYTYYTDIIIWEGSLSDLSHNGNPCDIQIPLNAWWASQNSGWLKIGGRIALWKSQMNHILWWFVTVCYCSNGPVESSWVFLVIAWWIFPWLCGCGWTYERVYEFMNWKADWYGFAYNVRPPR